MPHVTKRPKKTPLKRNEDERQITLISPASDGVKSELSGNSWLSSLSSSTPTSLQSSSAALPSHTTRSAVTRSLHTSALSNTSISIKDEDLPSLKSEPRDIEDLPTSTTEPKKATVSKSTKSQSTKPQSKQVGESSQPPPNFERMYELIEEMRGPGGKAADAPVDTMGCALLGSRTAEPRTFRFQTLVALMLSAQTKDTVTAPAMEQLKARVKDNFSAQGVLDTDPAVIHDCIRQVGFHNNKLKYILAAARTCVDQYGGDIPDSLEGLCSLAGTRREQRAIRTHMMIQSVTLIRRIMPYYLSLYPTLETSTHILRRGSEDGASDDAGGVGPRRGHRRRRARPPPVQHVGLGQHQDPRADATRTGVVAAEVRISPRISSITFQYSLVYYGWLQYRNMSTVSHSSLSHDAESDGRRSTICWLDSAKPCVPRSARTVATASWPTPSSVPPAPSSARCASSSRRRARSRWSRRRRRGMCLRWRVWMMMSNGRTHRNKPFNSL